MSGGTDRREDEQVPQFYGRIDEKIAEWETDVRLWQVEFKVEDRDRARDRPGGYAEAPNFHLHGNSDDDQSDTISESESNCSEQWYELDDQEQEALNSLRDARKKLQHATKSRRFYPKGGGCARSTGKSIDELKKVTSCNRCGAIGHWEEDCSQPARSRKKRSPLQRAKDKVVGSRERNLMVKHVEVHRTTRLWKSTTMVRKIKRHI